MSRALPPLLHRSLGWAAIGVLAGLAVGLLVGTQSKGDCIVRLPLVAGGGAPPAVLLPMRTRLDIPPILEREGMRTGAELGVQLGVFAEKTLSVWHGCTRYYAVDLWGHQENYNDGANVDDAEQEARYQATRTRLAPFGSKVVFLRNYTTSAAALIPDGSLDYVYVDARHDYCGVREDLEAYWPKLRRGGLLAGHDYLDAAEVAAKPHYRSQDWGLCQDGSKHPGAVKGAVNEFAVAHGLTVQVAYAATGFPSWIARKP